MSLTQKSSHATQSTTCQMALLKAPVVSSGAFFLLQYVMTRSRGLYRGGNKEGSLRRPFLFAQKKYPRAGGPGGFARLYQEDERKGDDDARRIVSHADELLPQIAALLDQLLLAEHDVRAVMLAAVAALAVAASPTDVMDDVLVHSSSPGSLEASCSRSCSSCPLR